MIAYTVMFSYSFSTARAAHIQNTMWGWAFGGADGRSDTFDLRTSKPPTRAACRVRLIWIDSDEHSHAHSHARLPDLCPKRSTACALGALGADSVLSAPSYCLVADRGAQFARALCTCARTAGELRRRPSTGAAAKDPAKSPRPLAAWTGARPRLRRTSLPDVRSASPPAAAQCAEHTGLAASAARPGAVRAGAGRYGIGRVRAGRGLAGWLRAAPSRA